MRENAVLNGAEGTVDWIVAIVGLGFGFGLFGSRALGPSSPEQSRDSHSPLAERAAACECTTLRDT